MADTEQENRLKGFAQFFKSYVGVMPLVTAAVSPLLTMANAIPVFDVQKTTLATYSGLLGFLLVAWVFYARSAFVPMMVPSRLSPKLRGDSREADDKIIRDFESAQGMRHTTANVLPLVFIVLSVTSYFLYFSTFDTTLDGLKVAHGSDGTLSRATIIQKAGVDSSIPNGILLQGLYLGIFLFAEAAFVFMALREYAYGVLKVSEREVLGDPRARESEVFYAPSTRAPEPEVTSPQA